jgi:hypothetical protein
MSVDRLKEALENIHESRKDRYLSMLKRVADLGIKMTGAYDPERIVEDAMRLLRKDDRIVWFLRLLRIHFLEDAFWRADEGSFGYDELRQAYEKALREFYAFRHKREGDLQARPDLWFRSGPRNSLFALDHYLNLGIADIDNFVFDYQTPHEVFDKFWHLEHEWKKKAKRVVTEEGNETDLIAFPDGWKWVNLRRPACENEGKAMGHCGNVGTTASGVIVLSLREPLKDGKWKPHATFILKRGGILGEMKGYGNQKPDKELHLYIVALLKLPIIKGLVGGGYLPENNFSLDDLDPEVRDSLKEEKPRLFSNPLYPEGKQSR